MRFGKAMALLAANLAVIGEAGGPSPAAAQTAGPIVLVCTWSAADRSTVTLDLAGKAVNDEHQIANPGGSPDPVISTYAGTITQITDGQIDWAALNNTAKYSLNRFTLDIGLTAPSGFVSHASCHKQDKQI